MKKINLAEITERVRHSPGGKFQARAKDISLALGRDPKSVDLNQRHPFDLALTRIPPGAAYCPYHAESAQWELYLVVAGRGQVREAGGVSEVVAGDSFLFKPGEAHQLSNPGEDDFVYYVIADNPIGDSCYYPDSGKWMVRKEGDENVIVKGVEADYFDGEE